MSVYKKTKTHLNQCDFDLNNIVNLKYKKVNLSEGGFYPIYMQVLRYL